MNLPLSRPLSEKIFKISCEVIPGGVNSPVRAFPGLPITPLIARKGKGDTVWDADGNGYIDYCGSWGALILGHAHPKVVQAAALQTEMGSSFGMATEVEAEVAMQIIKHTHSVEKIRFVSSGTEAGMSVVRLARGFTGKNTILKFDGNYHGHFDSFLIRAGSGVTYLNQSSSKGIPDDFVRHTASLPYNDIETARDFLRSQKELAAVMLEPVAGNMGVVPATREFLQMLKEETQKIGALLIFDEVITGFRVGLKSAQGLYKIVPDLTCFGKIIGGGFPAAAFGGRKEVMDCLAPIGQVYQAGTLSGNPVAMKAGLVVLKEVESPGFYEDLERKTDSITHPLRQAGIKVNQVGSMFTLFLGEEKYKKLFLYLFERGIYFPPSQYEACFISAAHTEDHLEETKRAIIKFIHT